ncbi:MAG: hypothetical protein Q4B09_06720 [Lachnospiraceae bacterium]|nr:hypothetical protein [Lachnospiraceae bacterium]
MNSNDEYEYLYWEEVYRREHEEKIAREEAQAEHDRAFFSWFVPFSFSISKVIAPLLFLLFAGICLFSWIIGVWKSFWIITMVDHLLIFPAILMIAATLAVVIRARAASIHPGIIYFIVMFLLGLRFTSLVYYTAHPGLLYYLWLNFWRTVVVTIPGLAVSSFLRYI